MVCALPPIVAVALLAFGAIGLMNATMPDIGFSPTWKPRPPFMPSPACADIAPVSIRAAAARIISFFKLSSLSGARDIAPGVHLRTRECAEDGTRPTEAGSPRGAVTVTRGTTVVVVVGGAVAGVEVALHRQPLGQDHVMRGQLDMEIGHPRHIHRPDRPPVHQMPHRHQHAIHKHRVMDAVMGALQQRFGNEQLVELTTTIGYYTMLAMVLNNMTQGVVMFKSERMVICMAMMEFTSSKARRGLPGRRPASASQLISGTGG